MRDGDGKVTTKRVNPTIFTEAITTMARGLLTFGGYVAGLSTGDPRNLDVIEGYKTSLVSIMDVVSLRRRVPGLCYPSEAWAKADWYITYLGYLHGGFNVRCNFLKSRASHYEENGLGPLTPARKAAEAKANKLMVALPLVSSIRQHTHNGMQVTSVNWKRSCKPRVIWKNERFVLNDSGEDDDVSSCPVTAAAQGWLLRGKRKREEWYDTSDLQAAWSLYSSSDAALPIRGRHGSIGAVAHALCSEAKRMRSGMLYRFD